jgi:hypothetical protein
MQMGSGVTLVDLHAQRSQIMAVVGKLLTDVTIRKRRAHSADEIDSILVVRCTFSDRILHSRMPLDPTHVCFKRTCV